MRLDGFGLEVTVEHTDLAHEALAFCITGDDWWFRRCRAG